MKIINLNIILIILIILSFISYNYNQNKKEYFYNSSSNSEFSIDKIYVINLEKDKIRLKNIEEQFNKQYLDFTRFNAIDGDKLTNNNVLVKKYFYPKLKIKYSLNQKACALSHISIWNDIADKKYNNSIIFEDDIIIPPNFLQTLENIMKQLPNNWDILFLGGGRINGDQISKNLIKPNINSSGNYGTFSYIINGNKIDKILKKCKNIKLHFDIFIQKELGKEFNIFFSYPQIVKHNYNNFSNILKRNRSNDEIKNNIIKINNI